MISSHKILVLVSACLLGEHVRYDGLHCKQNHPTLLRWLSENRVIAICPEVAGGLSIPRAPAEIQQNRVINIQGHDVTDALFTGADLALSMCQKHNIKLAVLKEGSPSCGVTRINNGEFKGVKIQGQGITTQLLTRHGVRVFSEHQWHDADQFLLHL